MTQSTQQQRVTLTHLYKMPQDHTNTGAMPAYTLIFFSALKSTHYNMPDDIFPVNSPEKKILVFQLHGQRRIF